LVSKLGFFVEFVRSQSGVLPFLSLGWLRFEGSGF